MSRVAERYHCAQEVRRRSHYQTKQCQETGKIKEKSNKLKCWGHHQKTHSSRWIIRTHTLGKMRKWKKTYINLLKNCSFKNQDQNRVCININILQKFDVFISFKAPSYHLISASAHSRKTSGIDIIIYFVGGSFLLFYLKKDPSDHYLEFFKKDCWDFKNNYARQNITVGNHSAFTNSQG